MKQGEHRACSIPLGKIATDTYSSGDGKELFNLIKVSFFLLCSIGL